MLWGAKFWSTPTAPGYPSDRSAHLVKKLDVPNFFVGGDELSDPLRVFTGRPSSHRTIPRATANHCGPFCCLTSGGTFKQFSSLARSTGERVKTQGRRSLPSIAPTKSTSRGLQDWEPHRQCPYPLKVGLGWLMLNLSKGNEGRVAAAWGGVQNFPGERFMVRCPLRSVFQPCSDFSDSMSFHAYREHGSS